LQRRSELGANAMVEAMSVHVKGFGPRAMSDLSPECAPKRTSADHSEFHAALRSAAPEQSVVVAIFLEHDHLKKDVRQIGVGVAVHDLDDAARSIFGKTG
jgi:hypothetical protein